MTSATYSGDSVLAGPNGRYASAIEAALQKRGHTLQLEWIGGDLVQRLDVPEWFSAGDNVLLAPPNATLPNLAFHPGVPPPVQAILVFGPVTNVGQVVFWGSSARIVVAPEVNLPLSTLACGGNSLIYIGPQTNALGGAALNARNGGAIVVEGGGLWSAGIRIFTDDMHAIRDIETGQRINRFGGSVFVARHVWLGLDVLLLPGAHIGAESVLGARSIVTRKVPPNTLAAGIPAVPIRTNITWTHEDEP